MTVNIPSTVEIDARREEIKAELAILRRLRPVALASEQSDQANDQSEEVEVREDS